MIANSAVTQDGSRQGCLCFIETSTIRTYICDTCTSEKLVDTEFEAFTQSADNI